MKMIPAYMKAAGIANRTGRPALVVNVQRDVHLPVDPADFDAIPVPHDREPQGWEPPQPYSAQVFDTVNPQEVRR